MSFDIPAPVEDVEDSFFDDNFDNEEEDDGTTEEEREEHRKKMEDAFVEAYSYQAPEITAELIQAKREALFKIGERLKKKFVGIDSVIDKLLEVIQTWYIIPQVLTRPLIVNLWGMTGVGKTDLVRTLVRELNYTDKFIEVQLSNKGTTSWFTSIREILDSSSVELDRPCILLLDEIQRFRTVDAHGHDLSDCAFQDVWMLLSDGRFAGSYSSKECLLRMAFSDLYVPQTDDDDNDKPVEEIETPVQGLSGNLKFTQSKKKRQPSKYKMSYYEAVRIKKHLRAKESVVEIMQWNKYYKQHRILEALNRLEVLEGESYPQMLIFIAGNLDEAYTMSSQTADAEIDADVMHAFSLGINMVDIKSVLRDRFKPEQIARFGNMHIIYPSLSRASYEEIISRKLHDVAEQVREVANVDLEFDDSVQDFIYRNGVFPAQGVRPVFSTISTTIESLVPFFIMEAKNAGSKEIAVSYEKPNLIAQFVDVDGLDKVKLEIAGVLDTIRKNEQMDNRANTAVHEAGHALTYGVMIGCAPTQISCNSTRCDDEGFVGIHKLMGSKYQMLAKMSILLSGQCAEEMVFGEDMKTSGSSSDIRAATHVAASLIRRYGMAESVSLIDRAEGENDSANYNISDTNQAIEELMRKAKKRAIECLSKRRKFLAHLSHELCEKERMSSMKFQEVADRFGVKVELANPKHFVGHSYKTMLEDFAKQEGVDLELSDNVVETVAIVENEEGEEL